MPRRIRRRMAFLALVLSVTFLLTACGQGGTPASQGGGSAKQGQPGATQGEPVKGGTLTVGTISDIRTLNPLFIDDVPSQEVANLVLAPLYNFDRQGNVIVEDTSLAAELPEISEDGLTYTVKLKETAKWTDGRPVTAEDVAWTIQAFANPEVGSPAIASFDKVKDR